MAISTPGSVEVSGGEVSATTGMAISTNSENSTVTISGGTVSTTTGTAVNAANVIVSGTGIVKATEGNAINISGSAEVTGGTVSSTTGMAINGWNADPSAPINVNISGGTVSSTTNCAIGVWNTNYPSVTVTGGLVFAYGNVIGNVIPRGFTDATGEGVVIAWNQAAGNTTYTQGTTTDITQSPVSATVVWDKSGTDKGISYTNGANTGFIPLAVSVLSTACDLAGITSPAGATLSGTTVTASVANSVASQVIAVTTSPAATWKLFSDAACTTEITSKTMTLAVGANTAYIQVTAEDGVTQKVYIITITRAAAISLSVSPTALNFAAESEQQTFTITSNTNWTVVSDASWATVSPASGSGNATITVTAATNTEYVSRTATVTISGTGVTAQTVSITQAASPVISVTGILFDVISVDFTVGDTEQLSASVTPSNATNQNLIWSSSNESVVTVDANGLITAVGEGTATITVTTEDGGFSASCTVNVYPPAPPKIDVTGVSLDTTSITLWAGENYQLNATVTPSDADNQTVYWVSNSLSVADVSNTGLVTAVGKGTATIIVYTDDGDYKASCTVKVLQQEVVVPDSTQTEPGGKGKIVLSLTTPTDALFSGSFLLTLPTGVQLDLDSTYLIGNLASLLTLNIVQKTDSSWTFTITPQALRSSNELVYSRIVRIGYIVTKTVTKGTYKAIISNLLFEFDNGAIVSKNELPVKLIVTSTTGMPELNAETSAYLYNERLYVKSPVAETIQVYSANGLLLYNFQKQVGAADYIVSQAPGSVLVVKGSSGWVKKVMQ